MGPHPSGRATFQIPSGRGLMFTRLSRVMRYPVDQSFPDSLANRLPFRIYYKLRPPISLQFCNYSKFLKQLTQDGIKNICENRCACSENEYKDFIYGNYGHVFTANLEIVQSSDLRSVMQFRAKFRLDRKES